MQTISLEIYWTRILKDKFDVTVNKRSAQVSIFEKSYFVKLDQKIII